MSHQPELDALIVRNIGDIGAAANRAEREIDPRLWLESGFIVTAAANAMGGIVHADAAERKVWLTHPDWLEGGHDVDQPQFYLELTEREEPGVEAEWTWLASFTGAWPGRSTIGMFVVDDRLKFGAWKKQLRSAVEVVDALVTRGFRYDSSTGHLYVPFLIDAELLAKAFEQDSFETALKPLSQAVAVVAAAHAELSALHRWSANG